MRRYLHAAILHQWYQNPTWIYIFLPLQWLYRLGAWLRHIPYTIGIRKPQTFDCKVWVIGNIVAGGSGKTPFVAWLVQLAQQQDKNVAVIVKGYGGSAVRTAQWVDADSDPSKVGDEAVMLASMVNCPIIACNDRRLAIQALLQRQTVDIVLCDDGLQDPCFHKDVRIVLRDAERGFGNGCLLPVGPLRQQPETMKPVDLWVEKQRSDKQLDQASVCFSLQAQQPKHMTLPCQLWISPVKNKVIHAVTAIANPNSFFADLEALGWHLKRYAFPDHHAFTYQDVKHLKNETVVMTAKDAVKCKAFAGTDWWVVPVELHPSPALAKTLLAMLA